MGEDFRLNGCVCTAEKNCYLHGVTIPDALRGLREAVESEADHGW